MKQKVYISGKITGVPNFNFPKFEAAEQLLLTKGFEVVNPLKLHTSDSSNLQWSDFMRKDIKALMDCDVIAVLDDWKGSRGAILEVNIALGLDMKMICAHTLRVIESQVPGESERIPLKYILKSVKREIDFRQRVYKNMVYSGKMTQQEADHEIKVMSQIQQDYKDLKFIGVDANPIQEQTQGTLF